MWRPGSVLTWNLETRTSPLVGVSAPSSSRMKVDLPDPDGPIRKTNSPLSILTLTLSSAGRADDLYCLVTRSRVIITEGPPLGENPGLDIGERCLSRHPRVCGNRSCQRHWLVCSCVSLPIVADTRS